MRKRTITVEYLNSICDSSIKVLERSPNPNYCKVKCLGCENEYEILINGVSKQKKCIFCSQIKFSKEASDKNLILSSDKLQLNSDYRIYKLSCNHFMLATPNSVRKTKNFKCKECLIFEYKQLLSGTNFNFIEKHKNQYITVQCKSCLKNQTKQISNIKYNRSINCKFCNEKSKRNCYCYIFKGEVNDVSFIKIGVSNNPYLRHLKFNSDNSVKFTFVQQIKLENRESAFKLEKLLKEQLKEYQIDKLFMKNYMENGFSECYTLDALQKAIDILKIQESIVDKTVRF